MPVLTSHRSQSIKHLPHHVDEFIKASLDKCVSSSVICQLVLQLYQKTITEVDVCHYRSKLSYNLLKATSDLPHGTPVEKLIAEFHLKKDAIFRQ